MSGALRWLAAAMLLLSSSEARALDPKLAVTQYRAKIWRTAEGLPQSAVDALVLGRDGWLWVGTQEGLARFDGVRFTVIDALRRETIHSLAATEDGVWAGTRGAGLRRIEAGRVHRTEVPGSAWVTSLKPHPAGGVWAGTYGEGLFQVDALGRARRISEVTEEKILALSPGPGGGLLIAGASGLFSFHEGRLEGLISDESVQSLHVDRRGSIWAGLGTGLMRLDPGGRPVRIEAVAGESVLAIREDRDGQLWLGTGSGLVRLDAGGARRLAEAEGRPIPVVAALEEDREGNLWAGTEGGGLMRLSSPRVVPWGLPEGLGAEVVWSVLEASDGTIYAATTGGGLRARRGDRFEPEAPELGAAVHTLAEDRAGALWVAGDRGVKRRPAGTARFEAFEPTGRPILGASVILEDRTGRVWIGTAGAGARGFGGAETVKLTTEEGLPHDVITAMVETPDGALWISTDGGLARFAGGELRGFGAADGLPHRSAYALHLDEKGVLWVATRGGLARVDGEKISAVRTGECAGWINQVVSDARGGLWLGSNHGLHRLDPGDGGACQSFGATHGMRSVETTAGYPPSAIRTRSGALWFATAGGLVEVDPGRLGRTNDVPPPVVIEEVRANGTVVGNFSLGPGVNELELSYTALALTAPEEVRFFYRLRGFDDAWTNAGDRRTAYFTNLAPGEYVFEVSASSEDGATGRAALPLTVAPLVHQTAWFAALVLAAIPALAFAAYRLRLRTLEARAAELEQQVTARTEELRRAQARVVQNEKMAALGQLVAGVSHELNNPVNFILANVDTLEERNVLLLELASKLERLAPSDPAIAGAELDYLREDGPALFAAFRNGAKRIAVIAENLRTFARAGEAVLAKEDLTEGLSATLRLLGPVLREVEVELDLEPELPRVRCAASQIQQVFANLLTNAAQAMGGRGCIRVVARREGGQVRFRFEDRGPGVPVELRGKIFEPFFTTKEVGQGTGLGLSISYGIVTAHGGTIEVLDREGGGAVFEVRLPIEGPG